MKYQTIMFGEYGLLIPVAKVYDVVTLTVDLRAVITEFRKLANIKPNYREIYLCRGGNCIKQFENSKRRRYHERTYHVGERINGTRISPA